MTDKRFKVALSFAGERRDYIAQVAELLASELGKDKVFYDAWYKAELARPNLDVYLQTIYHQQSHLIVPFVCIDYERKKWCGLEWRVMRELIKERQDDDIMPLRFDDTHIMGLFSIDGYIDLREHSPQETAEFILQRLKFNGHNVTTQIKPIEKTEPKIIIENNPIITPIIKPYQDWQTIGKYKVKDGRAIDTETNLMWLRFSYGQQWQNNTAEGEVKKLIGKQRLK
ncbi:MAG: TIR domain-containing protein [Methylococcaceae bacterium]